MPRTMTVSSTEFARKFADFKDRIRDLGIIHIANHQRLVGGFLSPKELENYERLKRRERELLKTGALADDVVSDLEAALEEDY